MIHLSEEQFDDALIGGASQQTTAHLEQCANCRNQLAEMQATITDFTAVTLSWSERRSATMPPQPVIEGPAWNRKLNWAVAAAALAITAIVLPLATRNSPGSMKLAADDAGQASTQQAQSAPQITSTTQPVHAALPHIVTVSDDVVANNNQMLQAIDAELDASVESSVQTFANEEPRGGGSQKRGLPVAISD